MLEIQVLDIKTRWHWGRRVLTAVCCQRAKRPEAWGEKFPFLTATCQAVKNLCKNQWWSELFNLCRTASVECKLFGFHQ